MTAAIMGLVPHHSLVNNTAPFVTAFQTIFTQRRLGRQARRRGRGRVQVSGR